MPTFNENLDIGGWFKANALRAPVPKCIGYAELYPVARQGATLRINARSVTITRCPTLGVYKIIIQGWIFRRIHLLPANMFDLSKNPSTPDLIHAFGPPTELEEITGCFEAEATCPTCDPGTCRDGRRTIVTRIPRWASPLIHAELEKLLNEHLLRP